MFDILSSRETAALIWLCVFVGLTLLNAETRKSFRGVIRALFDSKIVIVFCLLLTIAFCLILLLKAIGFWSITLLKDTIFWFFGFTIMTFFNINNAKDNTFFRSLLKESFRWTLFIEFLVNFYTFSLGGELILLPIISFIVLIKTFSATKHEHATVNRMFGNLLSMIGILLFAYIVFRTIREYQQMFTLDNLYSILLPMVLTILILPFLYILAVYVRYEELFVRIEYYVNGDAQRQTLKKSIYRTTKFNLSKIKMIDERINKFDLYHSQNIPAYIKNLLI